MRSREAVADAWDVLQAPAPTSVMVQGREVCVGQRVRLMPRAGGDVMDLALAGRTAVVASIDVTTDGEPHFAVTLDDDPGRDLGDRKYPGHRFFFRASEIEVVGDAPTAAPTAQARVLVAGIGNIFFSDDGFGVAVATLLTGATLAPSVVVRDFGIRGLDLAYALQEDYAVAILVDTVPKGGEPGTLYVIEPDLEGGEPLAGIAFDAHTMDPVRVLRFARSLGRIPPRVIVVGCEPETAEPSVSLGDALVALSAPVQAAVADAARVIESLLHDLVLHISSGGSPCPSEPGPG